MSAAAAVSFDSLASPHRVGAALEALAARGDRLPVRGL